jgi:hypothetical protein
MNAADLIKREERLQRLILVLLKSSVAASIAWALVYGKWEIFFFGLLTLVLMFIPEIIESRVKIELPAEFDLVIVSFLYMSIFLGEAINAYETFWWWDALLHISSGIILSFAGFLLLFIKVKQGNLQANPFFLGVIIFSLGMAFGGVWEIFEFIADMIFGTNMQKSGLVDTMWDLIVDGAGALVMAYVGAHYIQHGGKGPFHRIIRKFLILNPRILSKLSR